MQKKLRVSLFCLIFTLGCGQSWTKVKEFVGVKEQTPEDKEKTVQQYKVADDLVAKWTENLSKKGPQENGFVYHEGITEPDPWGNFLKIDYKKEGFKEVLTVSSAGPDGIHSTDDDVTRRRYADLPLWSGLVSYLSGPVGFLIFVWFICACLSLIVSLRKHPKKMSEIRILRVAAIAIFSPFIMIALALTGIIGVLVDGFDGFDIDIDL